MNQRRSFDLPIIIIGMHRSGTTLVAEILRKFGVFMGKRLDINIESTYFQKINKWLLSIAGASWDNPDSFDFVMNNEALLEDVLERLDQNLSGVFAAEYLGNIPAILGNGFGSLHTPWGWKDPRNTFTLPLYLKKFPEARVIHVYRHGVDVAQSLKVREDRILNTNKNRSILKWKQMLAISIPVIRGGILSSVICQDRQRAFDLWVKYMDKSLGYAGIYPGQMISIRYEDLLENPGEILGSIGDHIQMTMQKAKVRDIETSIRKSRAYAFKKDPSLVEFANRNSKALIKFVYES